MIRKKKQEQVMTSNTLHKGIENMPTLWEKTINHWTGPVQLLGKKENITDIFYRVLGRVILLWENGGKVLPISTKITLIPRIK